MAKKYGNFGSNWQKILFGKKFYSKQLAKKNIKMVGKKKYQNGWQKR